MTRRLPPGRWLVAASLGLATLACAPATPPGPEAAASSAAATPDPAPLAEARLPGSPVAVQITGVSRDGADVLEVSLALVNPGASVAPPASLTGGETWLAAAYLIDEERGKRFYVMRDGEGRAKCSALPAEVRPGRHPLSARFPAPGAGEGRMTVVLPGVAPFRGVAFPGTPAAGQSY